MGHGGISVIRDLPFKWKPWFMPNGWDWEESAVLRRSGSGAEIHAPGRIALRAVGGQCGDAPG